MSKANRKASKKATRKAQANGKAVSKAVATPKAAKAQVANQKPTATLDNCFRPQGGYWSVVQALRSLGMGKMHKHEVILPAIKKAMGSEAWKAFAAKKGKLSADQRAIVNTMVTSRRDYGKPLHAIGFEVRFDGKAKTAGLYKVGK